MVMFPNPDEDEPMPTEQRIQAIGNLRSDAEVAYRIKSNMIARMIKEPGILDELIFSLHEIAHSVNSEYGLPVYDSGSKAELRQAILKWVSEL